MTKTWSSSSNFPWEITIHVGTGQPPVYQQIVDQICFHIASGHLRTGDKLPPVRALAIALEINFNTVSKAYHDLAIQGIVVGRKGGGSLVAERPSVSNHDKQKKIRKLYQNLIAQAATHGVSAEEIKKFIQKEENP